MSLGFSRVRVRRFARQVGPPPITELHSRLQRDPEKETAVLLYATDNTMPGNDTPVVPQWIGLLQINPQVHVIRPW